MALFGGIFANKLRIPCTIRNTSIIFCDECSNVCCGWHAKQLLRMIDIIEAMVAGDTPIKESDTEGMLMYPY